MLQEIIIKMFAKYESSWLSWWFVGRLLIYCTENILSAFQPNKKLHSTSLLMWQRHENKKCKRYDINMERERKTGGGGQEEENKHNPEPVNLLTLSIHEN